MADEATRNDMRGEIPYDNYFVARFSADGRRINRDGRTGTLDWYSRWSGTVRLDMLIAADLEMREDSDEG